MRNPTTRDLSDRHAEFIRKTFGARITRGSGNQFNDQADNRMPRDRWHTYAFAFEGKATRRASLSVKADDWVKLVAQAHDLSPAMALRWYRPDDTLTPELDLIAVKAADFAAILSSANTYEEMRDR